MGHPSLSPLAIGAGVGVLALVALAIFAGDAEAAPAPAPAPEGGPGTWFTWEDLTHSATATKHGLDNTPGEDARARLEELVREVLDPLADYFAPYDTQIRVTSGFRAPMVNKLAGGRPSSQHQSGEAVDIQSETVPPAELAAFVVGLALPFDQLIVYPRHVHVSHRATGNRAEILLKTDSGYAPMSADELRRLAGWA